MIRLHNRNMVPKKKTRGWDLLVEWKDGSFSWIIQSSGFSQIFGRKPWDIETAFKWWLRDVIICRNRIIGTYKLTRRTYTQYGTPLFRNKWIISVYLLKPGRRDHWMNPGVAKNLWGINKSVVTWYLISIWMDDSHVRPVMLLYVTPLIPHPPSPILELCPEIVSELHLT